MRFSADATYSPDRNPSGVSVYSREILWGLARAQPEHRFEFCYRPHRLVRSFRESLPINARRRVLWSGTRADVFHGLNQRLDAGHFRRAICTFHDLFVLTGEYSSAEFRKRFAGQAQRAAGRADRIIAVSQFTADQVRDLLAVEPQRIRVIRHGVRAPENVRPAALREKVILFVGALQRRKNIARLIRAFAAAEPGWKLVLAGGSGYGAAEELAAIDQHPRRRDIECLGYVTEGRREQLYASAGVFAFPSLDEGFGIPVLEAMAHGVPVLTSNRSALPEVSGSAALLVDPEQEDEIAEALQLLTRDAALRARLGEQGLKRSADFRWETAVAQTWDVYRELV